MLGGRLSFALVLLLAVAGCSKADLLNSLIPRDGYALHRNIPYGDHDRQTLDVYVPEKKDAAHSVIVFFYGGSWQTGEKELYRFTGQAFASKGYTVVVADYRLYPEVHFPAFVEDGAKAVGWVHEHIGKYGGNPRNMYLAGHSAGAYIAVMLTLDERYLKAEGGSAKWIKGTIGIAGPYDFLPMTDPNIIALFSTARDVDTQPVNHVRRKVPPVLLLTGDEDDEVKPRNSGNLAVKLRKYGNTVYERTYPGVAHIGIVLALADGFRGKAPVLDDIDTFIRANNNGEPFP